MGLVVRRPHAGWCHSGRSAPTLVWDTSSDDPPRVLKAQLAVAALAFAPDNTRLACARVDRVIEVWDATAAARNHVLSPPEGSTQSMARLLAWSPDALVSKEKFSGRMHWHVEFRLPPREARASRRSAEGFVLLPGGYRVRIADSRGQPADQRSSCGAIFDRYAPAEDAARAPGTWQSFDLVLDPPVCAERKPTVPAKLSVRLNNLPLHRDVPVTPDAGLREPAPCEPGPLVLGDAGDKVQFRNVWLLPLGEHDPAID